MSPCDIVSVKFLLPPLSYKYTLSTCPRVRAILSNANTILPFSPGIVTPSPYTCLGNTAFSYCSPRLVRRLLSMAKRGDASS